MQHKELFAFLVGIFFLNFFSVFADAVSHLQEIRIEMVSTTLSYYQFISYGNWTMSIQCIAQIDTECLMGCAPLILIRQSKCRFFFDISDRRPMKPRKNAEQLCRWANGLDGSAKFHETSLSADALSIFNAIHHKHRLCEISASF